MNGNWIKDYWPLLVGAVGLVGFAYLMDYRLAAVEKELSATDLKQMRFQVSVLKCEVKNIKKVIRQQPEVDCD